MNYPQPYLQPYKGKDTRHDCPSCKAKLSFTQYLDGNTHKPIHDIVGKCNRESKCGYHYTPRQYFIDNPLSPSNSQKVHFLSPLGESTRRGIEVRERDGVRSLTPPLGGGWVGSACLVSKPKTITPPRPVGTIPFHFVQKSASYKSNFVRFLCEFLTVEQMTLIGENYALGATKSKEVIFWQIDIHGKVRTGKIMQYNPETGRRLKHESGAIDWVHNKLKKSGTLPQDFNLQQCFFGEHLLTLYPDKTVAIVESEKSALIASAFFPDLIWLAAGNLNGLSVEKSQVLKSRNIILFPDLGAFEKWREKAQMLNSLFPSHTQKIHFLSPCGESPQRGIEVGEGSGVRCSISTLLEDIATPEAKANGLDVADFMIEQLSKTKAEPVLEIQSHFSPTLQSMLEINPALFSLMDHLNLEEI